jgi:hypothetical protein
MEVAREVSSQITVKVLRSGQWIPPNMKVNALMRTGEGMACDYFTLWDDDDYHLPNKLANLLEKLETSRANGAVHSAHYLVSGKPRDMQISLTERPHPNSGMYRSSIWKPLEPDDTVGYDQTLFFRGGCDKRENQINRIAFAYFWGGEYHHSASGDLTREAWSRKHQELFPPDKPFRLDQDPEAMATITLLDHITNNNEIRPRETSRLVHDNTIPCPACAGSGIDAKWTNTLFGPKTIKQLPCPACAGKGAIA